jgi:hypothetical protein
MAKVVKVTYVDIDKDAPEVEVHGKKLKDGESVEVPETEANKFKDNRWFKVGTPTEATPEPSKAAQHQQPAPKK